MERALVIGYLLGSTATFLFLMWEDWNDVAEWWGYFVIWIANLVLAAIWPIYWLILRWLA